MKLTGQEQRALAVARQALKNAYAPYSGFHVGAALIAEDGRIFSGCNVENASYGLTMCAERVALGCAVAAGVRRFTVAAVASDGLAPPPCGACRQVLAEFLDEDAVVVASGADGETVRFAMGALLPHRFELRPSRGTDEQA